MLGNYFQQTTSADNIFRYFFLGALKVNPHSVNYKDNIRYTAAIFHSQGQICHCHLM